MVFHRDQGSRARAAREFEDADIARCYSCRPPYPEALFEYLLGVVQDRKRALDLGSGPGKIARILADSFEEVVAIEPSRAMIETGKKVDNGMHDNLKWVRKRIEDYEDKGNFGIVTAGNSIHWFDHSAVFPKLERWTGTLAVITGDEPDTPPCGKEPWVEFVSKWLSLLSRKDPTKWQEYDPLNFTGESNRHERWIDVAGRKNFRHTYIQSISDFIESQHSRATWGRRSMGTDLSGKFDNELRTLLTPFLDGDYLKLTIQSTLIWGKPRASPAD